ncbi:hypothetical protein SCP_0412180 [Sparassis crispa]|uniref:Uncharacterized protein n=1 Tax=Sparassis crispa TaxID=139825 RepID=A0A401GKX8_9APHY|nr:hypothetical protein SCP_0412180 [Sparassis crispa]GBE82831.1 hypothetical protein SCP_0412180 [Sparassis crispa]
MFSPLASQVGGHPGVLSSEDGSLVIKASLPTELAFYESVSCDPNFAPLKPFVPRFYGTLRLAGKVDETTATQDPTSFTVLEAVKEIEKDEYRMLTQCCVLRVACLH